MSSSDIPLQIYRQTTDQNKSTLDAPSARQRTSHITPALLRSPNKYASEHKFAYRVSFPTLFWGDYYFAAFAGPERRNKNRLASDGQSSHTRRSIFFSAAVILLLAMTAFGVLCAMYLLKSALNIDLFEGASILHPLFEKGFR